MSECLAIVLPVEPAFWNALSSGDTDRAEVMVKEAIMGRESYHSGEVYREDDLISEHLCKYVTVVRGTVVTDSSKISEIEFTDDMSSGTAYVQFQVEVYIGCREIDGMENVHEPIRLSFDKDKRTAFMHVLEFPLELDRE